MRLSIIHLLPLAASVWAAPTSSIADKFIVVMKKGTSETTLQNLVTSLNLASSTRTVSFGSFSAFHGALSQSLIETLTNTANVQYIEPVSTVSTNALVTQTNSPWGLGRISHKNKGITEYVYDDSAGSGTFAYIIDTGIYAAHNDFGGRALFGANFAGDGEDFDGNGHGTHCSGTIGSMTYGVSKKISLIGVKVLDASGSGSSSGVLEGIQFAVKDAQSKGRIGKAVGSMSLGGIFSQATNDAVAAAVDAGLFMAVAAGNDGLPADLTSPASEPKACTVGATDKTDARASYSNYGKFVDIFAPGTDVLSTWIDGPDDTNTISGTSMATPHVAGLAAYLMALPSEMSPAPAVLCQRIRTLANKNKLALGLLLPALTGTPNLLAYNGNGA